MTNIERMRQLRRAMTAFAETAGDEAAAAFPSLFPEWAAGISYIAGGRVQHGGLLYKCLTAHVSQAGWAPDAAPSLWVRIDDPAVEWPAWRQPQGSTDAYPLGAKVSHNGRRWISTAANNVWEPGVSGWEEAKV